MNPSDRDPAASAIHVLVVEDSFEEAALLRAYLEHHGFRIHHAPDGIEALKALDEVEPDLLLLDLTMPRMDGIEVCRRLKANYETMNIPIIVVSGQGESRAIVRAFESGADDYVVKPYDLPSLEARIRANLRRTSREITTNPLTRIPGINFLHARFPRLKQCLPALALALCDIDNFKAFNDRYGFNAGDRVICAMAEILRHRLSHLDPQEVALVHVGGDDFIFVCHPDEVVGICRHVIADFDDMVPQHYDEEDRRRACIQARNRRGQIETFPLMTLSIGVADARPARHASLLELSETANEIKNHLKTKPTSVFLINRRDRRG